MFKLLNKVKFGINKNIPKKSYDKYLEKSIKINEQIKHINTLIKYHYEFSPSTQEELYDNVDILIKDLIKNYENFRLNKRTYVLLKTLDNDRDISNFDYDEKLFKYIDSERYLEKSIPKELYEKFDELKIHLGKYE